MALRGDQKAPLEVNGFAAALISRLWIGRWWGVSLEAVKKFVLVVVVVVAPLT